MENLQQDLAKNFGDSDAGIYLFLSVDVKYENPWQILGNDDDDEPDDDEPFTSPSEKLCIKNLDQLPEKV